MMARSYNSPMDSTVDFHPDVVRRAMQATTPEQFVKNLVSIGNDRGQPSPDSPNQRAGDALHQEHAEVMRDEQVVPKETSAN